MKYKIICIGSACKDVFFPTSEGKTIDTPGDLLAQKKIEFELGAKYKIETRYEALGGCAANVACGLSRLGITAACYSHIGDDYIADWIKEELNKNGVDTDLISHEKNCPSDMSAIIVDKNNADRVIFSNQKANGLLKIELKKIAETEWYFVGDLHGEWEQHLNMIFDTAREKGIKTAFNPRQANIHENVKKIIECIPKTDILFLNKDESIEIISNLPEKYSNKELDKEKFLAKTLYELGAKIVVITDGIRGAWAYDGEKQLFVPGEEVNAVDSTGAGDSFGSAYLAAHIKEKAIGECLEWGIANSSSVVQHYGAIGGLLREEEIISKK
jgi:sugar/nucleoside kinase (ribokinase family)